MYKWIEEMVLKRSTNNQQTHENMSNILFHKGNTNQSYIKTLSHPSHNGYHQENKKQMLARM
jgi:hypothetical protein